MKIVHLEDYFHPEAGYQLNLLSKYMAAEGHEVYVVCGEMEKMPPHLTSFFSNDDIEEKDRRFTENTGVKIVRVPIYKYVSGRAIYHKSIFRTVDALNPDILFVHGNDTFIGIQYILRSKRLKYPLILDSHMLEMASVNKFNKFFRLWYRMFITPIIKRRKLTVIRTQNDKYVEKCLGIPLEMCPWMSTGSDIKLFHPDEEVKKDFRNKYDINDNEKIIVYAGKLDVSKGGLLLAEAIHDRLETSEGIKPVFVIVGNTQGEYGKKIDLIFESSENRIIRFPTQVYTNLAKFYQVADFAIFPKQCSLSFYDVQACGVPVLLENNSINLERLNHNNGFAFMKNQVNEIRRVLLQCLDTSENEYSMMSKMAMDYVINEYNYTDIAKQYLRQLYDSIDKFNYENN